MAIPKYDELLRPILDLAAKQDITRRSATEVIVEQLTLTDEECNARIPSGGSTYINHRTGWAMTFLTKASLIEKVPDVKFTYRISQSGRYFLALHPNTILTSDLKQVDGWEEAWEQGRKRRLEAKEKRERIVGEQDSATANLTPLELLEQSAALLEEALRADLLDRLLEVDPYRFEHIVVDLLFAMGYGGSRQEAVLVTKRSNDEGIDGVINEDRLGLDVVYVQAKRWQNTVGRKEIQSFVGALTGKQAQKGVFITTSSFASSAVEYADAVSQRIVLIDGGRLTELMIEHDIGVATNQTVLVKRIDSDYFEDS